MDVLAFEVTSLIDEKPSLVWQSPTYDLFVDENNSRQWDITVSDDILVVGYPLGFSQGVTNLPLVRSGMIATRIDQAIRDDFLELNGTRRQRTLPGFLFDGATIPGSSGSPVILKPTPSRLINGAMVTAYVPALLLGIVAETRYAPIQVGTNSIPSFAGLGLAFHAETIKETIELFFTV